MQIAPEITFDGSDSSDAARAQILSEIERLEQFSVDVNRNSKGVPKSAQIRFGLL
jgi:hypothetical protein